MKLRWLHISDIHFHMDNYQSKKLRSDLLDRIKSYQECDKIDVIFCTGDILDKNKKCDPGLLEYIYNIINAAKIDPNMFIIVPGNHDRDRKAVEEIVNDIYVSDDPDNSIEYLKDDKYSALISSFQNFFEMYMNIMGEEYYLDNSNPHQIQAVSGLSILKLNTAWLERNSSDSKLLRIGKHKLYSLFETLRSSPTNVKIAIGHHPFEAMHENDENDIMSMFHQFGVEIYLCGHVHKPFIQYNNYYDVLEIGCTSSAKSDSVSGGYILGTIDSDANCYKVEYYRWGNNRWYTAPDIVQTDDNGIYYFNTSSFTNSSKTVAVTFKTMQGNVTRKEIEKTLRTKSFEIVQYPCSIINTNDVNWAEHLDMVAEFAKQVISLREKEIFIFPLAHVPLLIAFGYELQRNSHYTIFQYARFQETWIYLNCDEINPKININYAANGNRILALSIAISTEINISDIQNAMADVDNYDLFSFDIDGPHIPGNPLNHNDVMVIARTIFEKVCPVANRYSDIHIFASVSAGLAIEIGRIIQQSIFPTIHLYNYDRSYKYCYSINEK